MTAASPKLTPAWVTSPELSRSENLGILDGLCFIQAAWLISASSKYLGLSESNTQKSLLLRG